MAKIEDTEQSIYTIMREMDPGDKLVVTIEGWQLARDYAWLLKKNFEVEFRVRRMHTKNTKRNFILVERIR